MDLDANVVWLATRGPEDLSKAIEAGITPDLFIGGWSEVWSFIRSYTADHSVTPGAKLLFERFGTMVEEPEEIPALKYMVGKMYERSIRRMLKAGLSDAAEKLDDGDIDSCIASAHALSQNLRQQRSAELGVMEIADAVGGVREMYDRVKRGEIGIPFPWEAMNDMTLGIWPGTMNFFTARPGIGKTWTAIIIAWNAFVQHRKKVLVISPEMGATELAERVISKHAKLSYGDLISGQLGNMGGEQALDQAIADVRGMRGFTLIEDDARMGQEAIEDAVAAEEPDLIVADSVYMLRVAEGKAGSQIKNRMDRIIATIEWLRGLTRKTGIPVLGISQLSRNARMTKSDEAELKKGRGTGGLEDTMAMSDQFFWYCNNLFAMFQDDDMKLDRQMLYVPLKARRMAKWSAVVAQWDMDGMNFGQIGTKVESSNEYSDDEHDSVF